MSGQTALSRVISVTLTVIMLILSYWLFSKIIMAHPVDVHRSDIIPQTQVLVHRSLHHEFPYKTIPDWGYDLFPTYQPMQWLPFAIAEFFHFDYRLLAFWLLMTVSLLFIFFAGKKNINGFQSLVIPLLVFMPVIFIAIYQPSVYEVSLENLIAAYYLLLCMAIFPGSFIFIGGALLLCILSRYSLVLWVPLFLFILCFSGEKRKALQIIIFCFIGILLIYVIPFLLKDGSIFIKGYHYHTQAALNEWKGQSWQQPGEKPFQLFRGLGFAGLFYDHYKGTIEEKLNAYRLLHLFLSAGSVIALGILFYFKRKTVSYKVFALAGLKIYLAVFYHFIQIPYDYLYVTLIYISIPIVWLSLKRGANGAGSLF